MQVVAAMSAKVPFLRNTIMKPVTLTMPMRSNTLKERKRSNTKLQIKEQVLASQ
ncbi:hypothetical protein QJS10_CPA06g01398 [Acorus calamus]|uniref:Uncharacterized protein n=1 Tax=Acorus calamus TaxID=4465 RepID=A0AAV9EN15_ACOCL|nr:hypothetical protein QJS10_CPA06g01398 [Acorus calamus]